MIINVISFMNDGGGIIFIYILYQNLVYLIEKKFKG